MISFKQLKLKENTMIDYIKMELENEKNAEYGYPFISDYFALKIDVLYNEITDLYFYAGSLISKSNKYKKFEELADRVQRNILQAFLDLDELDFRNFNEGIYPYGANKCNYYCIRTETTVHLFVIEFRYPPRECKNMDVPMFKVLLRRNIRKFRRSAKLVFSHDYII